MPRKILVTSALPYANGALHIGHIIEAVQTDIWVRFQRMQGHDCIYVCAEDTHGTPVMIKAQAEGVTPEQLITRVAAEHRADYEGFLIGHDHFHSTHSPENKAITAELYGKLKSAGHITTRSVRQAYDEKAGMFLPDRYVKGECPVCHTVDQYGDSCENCGSTYTPDKLINPISTLSGTPPVLRESEHYFFKLGEFTNVLREWLESGGARQPEVRAKLAEWFEAGLQDWDISRDAPYFGFEIPGAPGKYFYVWFDAPIGYLGSFKALCALRGLDYDEYLAADSKTELYHFIGKDISYFHNLFWPAVLHGSGCRKPTGVFVHGFLTINGAKMSKSRGTFITAKQYLSLLPPEALRFYFASKLGAGVDDIDLSLEDFVARVNSDVVGKLVNIASRCAGFVARGGGKLATQLPVQELYDAIAGAPIRDQIARHYENREYSLAIRQIMGFADLANQYVDTQKPWALAKDPTKAQDVLAVCTQGLNLFRVLMSYLAPVMPEMAKKAGKFLGVSFADWNAIARPLLDSPLQTYEPLALRLDPAVVKQLIATEAVAPVKTAAKPQKAKPVTEKTVPPATPAAAGNINIADFAKLDLRVATVLDAKTVEGSDKLLQLTLDLGSERRNVFSGIRSAYADPAKLIGRQVVMIANLEPRKMRFGVSEGMVLCAAPEAGAEVFLLSPDSGATAGMKVS
jgi:methionyl-tRNA synthetase